VQSRDTARANCGKPVPPVARVNESDTRGTIVPPSRLPCIPVETAVAAPHTTCSRQNQQPTCRCEGLHECAASGRPMSHLQSLSRYLDDTRGRSGMAGRTMSASTSILAATDVPSPPVLRPNALDDCAEGGVSGAQGGNPAMVLPAPEVPTRVLVRKSAHSRTACRQVPLVAPQHFTLCEVARSS